MVALAAALAGCTGHSAPDGQLDPAATTVEYAFTDASIDSRYQRSFVLTAADGHVTVVVTGPGDETVREEQPLDPEVIEHLVTAFNDGDLAEVFAADPSAPCTGTSSQRLTLDDGEHSAETAFTYCGDNNADARTQLVSAVAPLLEPFDMAALTEGRYPG